MGYSETWMNISARIQENRSKVFLPVRMRIVLESLAVSYVGVNVYYSGRNRTYIRPD